MRWIGRSLLVTVFLCSAWFFVIPTASGLWQAFRTTSGDLENARASLFFPLHKKRWLTFDVPENTELFRLYSHAALKAVAETKSISYTLDYQWLDENGAVLEEKQHHITTSASAMITPPGTPPGAERRVPARFYDHQRSRPSRDQALYFDANGQPGAQALRLRVNSMDADIVEIGIRSYQLQKRSTRDLDIAWQRMSSAQRDSLSKGALYPSFLLSESERENLMSSFWKPIGPLGVLDKDYQIKTLYQHDSAQPVAAPETPAAGGLFAGPNQRVTLTLQQAAARYRIEWRPLSEGEAQPELQLRWQDEDGTRDLHWQPALKQTFWEGPMGAGLLQLASDQPVTVKFFLWEAGDWQDIAPEKLYSRAFNCSADAALQYALAPGASPQSLRIDARSFMREDHPESGPRARIKLQVRDESGATGYSEVVELPTQNNPYQQFYDASSVPGMVFERVTSYLDAAPGAHTLHISCDGHSLVNVYSRPWQHPVRRSLPASENRLYAYQQREPAWFLLQPKNLNALIRQKRVSSLVWYFKPRESDGIAADGQYNRRALVAGNADVPEWLVFSSHESDSYSRLDSRTTAYQPLDTAGTLFFAGSSNEKQVRPSAVYLRKNTQPEPVQVWIDHALALETTIVGNSGRVRLPYLKTGPHHVEIRSKATRWYVNNTAESGQTHLMRNAYAMPWDGKDAALTFSIATSGQQQQLGFWLFAPGQTGILNCRLSLQAQRTGTLQHSHTLVDYNYQLHSSAYENSIVLQRKEGVFRGPIRLVMGLEPDLPAQTATARLACDRPGVLASAGVISRGLAPYRVFEEPNEA